MEHGWPLPQAGTFPSRKGITCVAVRSSGHLFAGRPMGSRDGPGRVRRAV